MLNLAVSFSKKDKAIYNKLSIPKDGSERVIKDIGEIDEVYALIDLDTGEILYCKQTYVLDLNWPDKDKLKEIALHKLMELKWVKP